MLMSQRLCQCWNTGFQEEASGRCERVAGEERNLEECRSKVWWVDLYFPASCRSLRKSSGGGYV